MAPTIEKFVIGARVSLYNPDRKRNGLIKGIIAGSGYIETGPVYIVELDTDSQSYIRWDTKYEQYISHVVVAAEGVFSAS